MGWINDHILLLHGFAAYAIVFALPALEASIFLGFVIPGEIAVILGGVLAYEGKVSLAGVLAAAIAGAVIGDSVGYEVGRHWGDALLRRLPRKVIKPEHIEQGKESIKRLGGRAVFVGRFTAALRAIVPGLCGVSRMPYRQFLLWNFLGGACWATLFVLLGHAAGNGWHKIDKYASWAGWIILGVVVVAIAGFILFRRRQQKRKDDETAAEMRERESAATE